MFLFQHTKDLQSYLAKEHVNNRTVGFVPTMGALHEGHLSLIAQSKAENQITVCSIFVNPTQFNDAADLEKYPRTPDKDLLALEKVGCEVVFLPTVAEIYPKEIETKIDIDLAGLDLPMEGANRPGHFNGVIQVVNRLLDLVTPDYLYMGQKDYQQYLICKKMIEVLNKPVKIKPAIIKRAEDGLALSSRNTRLTSDMRARAPMIYQTLLSAKDQLSQGVSIKEIEKSVFDELTKPNFRPEYFSIVNGETLKPILDPATTAKIVACTAVWAGDIRLIDNMLLKG